MAKTAARRVGVRASRGKAALSASKPEPSGGEIQEPTAVTSRAKTATVLSDEKAPAKKTTRLAAKRPASVQPKALVQRVYRTIDMELTKLEKQNGASSQDRERASRALSQMVSSLEKAIDMQRDMVQAQASRAKPKDTEALRYAEDLRREIAERLERLQRKRGPRGSTS